jgi:hypothetical protein
LRSEGLHFPFQVAADNLALLRRIHSSLGRVSACTL